MTTTGGSNKANCGRVSGMGGEMRKSILIFAAALFALGTAGTTARADFVVIFQPNPVYLSQTTKLAITDADFTVTSMIGPIGFSPAVTELTVPTSWATWGCPPQTEDCTPRVLWTGSSETPTFTLPSGNQALGFEAEPNIFEVEHIIANFYDGTALVGTVNYDINGQAGALLMAADTHTNQFTSVTITDTNGSGGFAIGDIRYGTPTSITPEPTSILLFGSGLLSLAALRKRLQKT